MDFSQFPEITLLNSVYTCHDYALLRFPILGQAPYTGTDDQKARLRQ